MTKSDVVNLALLRIGISQTVTDVDTDASRESLSAVIFWDAARLFVLRDYDWPFARKYAALSLVSGSASVPANQDWIYSYSYPDDCVFVRRIVNCYGRQATSPPPYVIGRSSAGLRLVYTNQGSAAAEYTVNITAATEFEPEFASMLAWRLAAELAAGLGRSAELAKQAREMYASERAVAITRSAAEGEYAVASGDPDPRVREFFNLALTRIGISRSAAGVDPELTFQQLWPRVNFADERDYVLRDFAWPFATKYADLDPIAGASATPVNRDWTYAYQLPSDCLYARRLVTSAGRLETVPVPFRIGRDASLENEDTDLTLTLSSGSWIAGATITITASEALFAATDVGNAFSITDGTDTAVITVVTYTSTTVVSGTVDIAVAAGLQAAALDTWTKQFDGRCVYTNEAEAQLEYTVQITDPDEFDPAFISMLAWRIAATLAPSVANVKRDPKMVDRCFQHYEVEKSRAQRAAMNEGQSEELLQAEWIRGR